ncbi:MAG TPA: acetylglutamate kinase [Gemmatimonadaceae bacterium]|nr:acetylglutamate kinase [Gemmatimonadaceae bacterium]
MSTPAETRVIKLGGRAQGDPALPAAIAGAVRAGARVVVVHGGGDEVTQLQRRMGVEPTFHNGRRVTTVGDLAIVRMVLSGTVNKRLVGAFGAAGVRAVGISGEDGGLLTCRRFGDGILGEVGEPDSVNPAVLTALLDAGFTPVVSPLGRFADGSGCNVNGDDAAAAIAAALGADELLLVADVPGVLDAAGRRIPQLDGEGMAALIATGGAKGGMIAKLESARLTLERGVARVRIGDFAAIDDPSAGTTLVLATAERRPQ